MRASSLLLLLLPFTAFGQEDTIRVQTLTFDSITTRRGWWVFPDASHTYRKVLMHHTLKCDPATTWDSYDCGEWDYLTYNFIHEHTGAMDSTALDHPEFLLGVAAPDSLELVGGLLYDLRQRAVVTRTLTGTLSASVATFPAGATWENSTLGTQQGPARSQFLFTASELLSAGLVPGPIERLVLHTPTAGTVDRMIVRMASTASTTVTGFTETGLITALDRGVAFDPDSTIITLTTPYTWDGSSNLLVELDAENVLPSSGVGLRATDVGTTVGAQESGRDGWISVNNDHVGVAPTVLAGLSDQVTITFRAFGDAVLPQNTTVFEAVDAEGRRILNIHLPWSDGNVYWDAGNDGSGYDRINKAATSAQQEGQWNDWAFVKNTVSGQMKIYLNGVLWHSGTGKTKPLSGIARFKVCSDANGNLGYPGRIDDVNVFATEVSAATIAQWHARRVDASHPDAASLVISCGFDELPTEFSATNLANASAPAWLMGTVKREYRNAVDLGRSWQATTVRPDIGFVQGSYTDQFDTTLATDPVVHAFAAKETYQVVGHDAVPLDTVFGWQGAYTYTFDPGGAVIDSSYAAGAWSYNGLLEYFGEPFEVVNDREVGRYITPYGIGLTLGPEGFRWTFDVTDYQWLLHDSVELSAGNTQELIDLEFEMIEGTPPRPLVRQQRPWGPQRSYGFGALSNDTELAPVTVPLDPAATQWVLRSRITGHGDATSIPGVQGCCEFRDNTHFIDVEGAQVDSWHVWRTNDCALNPVYPQGGTWLYAREGWCPGDIVPDHTTDLTPFATGDSLHLDYRITPVPVNNPGMAGGNYVMNMDLFEYGPAALALDAEIVTVERPTDTDLHRRDNPICKDPVVILRNAGSTVLTSVTFTYGINGGPSDTHTWTGSLTHMEQAAVTLPVGSGWFWNGTGDQTFTVSVSAPNGGSDQYTANDAYTTHFTLPTVYPENFILYYKTNNRSEETSCTIKDLWGTTVYQQDWGDLGDNVTRYDTLALSPGCYTLELFDSGNDGVYYWADPGQGSGFFRFKSNGGSILKNFEREFGRSIHYAFAISDIVGIQEQGTAPAMEAFPNPSASGSFTLALDGMDGPATVEVVDGTGRPVHQARIEARAGCRIPVDLAGHSDGIYLVRVTSEVGTTTARLIKQ